MTGENEDCLVSSVLMIQYFAVNQKVVEGAKKGGSVARGGRIWVWSKYKWVATGAWFSV